MIVYVAMLRMMSRQQPSGLTGPCAAQSCQSRSLRLTQHNLASNKASVISRKEQPVQPTSAEHEKGSCFGQRARRDVFGYCLKLPPCAPSELLSFLLTALCVFVLHSLDHFFLFPYRQLPTVHRCQRSSRADKA